MNNAFQKDGDRLKEDSIFTYGKLEYVPSFNDSCKAAISNHLYS